MAINIKPSHKGLLHKNLGVPQGRKIPASKLAVKSTDSEAVRKRKQFAINAKKWKHEDGGFIDNRSLPEYKDGGPVKPIVVTDPNNPRLKAYNDSNTLYNNTNYLLNPNTPKQSSQNIQRLNPESSGNNIPGNSVYSPTQGEYIAQYKKPVQTVEYQAPTQQQKKVVAKPSNTGTQEQKNQYWKNKYGLIPDPNIKDAWIKPEEQLTVQPQVQQQPIIQAQPPVINKDTIYQTPVMHQGYRNYQKEIKPGLYAEGGEIDYDYRWDNGLPRAINRAAYRKGGRVLPRYDTGGQSGTGANTAGTQSAPDYTNAAIGVGGALVGAAAELIPGVTHTDADGNVTSSRKSIGAEVLGDAAQGASMGMALGPWGALAGAGLGAIYGGVKGVMNKNAADAADAKAEAERQNRITNNTIRNGPKTYTGQSVNTGSTFIAREGGNVPNDNFDYSAGGEFSNTDNNVIHAPEMGGYFIKRK